MKEIFEQINNAKLSGRQLEEGSENPTDECRAFAIEAANTLYTLYRLIPLYAAATVEDGIYLRYKNDSNEMHVEIYNDLGVVAIVMSASDILGSFAIDDLDFKEVYNLF